MSQFEIEQDLQRFASSFCERVSQAGEDIIAAPNVALQEPALKRTLLYSSAALDIVSGPMPELNLLDMTVFVTLCRDTFERHWLKNVFGEVARPMFEVLDCATHEIWDVSHKLLNEAQTQLLRNLIRNYQDDHPAQTYVEGVRFSEFASLASGARAQQRASGLMASVHSATRTADQAVLLGERVMFLLPRLPFILRLHARVGALELVADGAKKLGHLSTLIDDAQRLRPMIGEVEHAVSKVTTLAEQASQVAIKAEVLSQSAMPLMHSIERLLLGQHEQRAQHAISASDALVGKVQGLLEQCAALTAGNPAEALAAASTRIENSMQRVVWQLAAVGAGLIVLFWCGFFLTRSP